VLEAVQRRLVRLHDVRNELEAGPRAGSARLRRAVEAAERGAWSAPEAELTALLEKSRLLPPAWLNPHLFTTDGVRLPTPDGWFDDVGLAVQVHSKRYHADELDWEKTVSGDGVFRRIRDRTRRGDTPTDRGAARCCPHPHRARV
jgi:hypothetical protein